MEELAEVSLVMNDVKDSRIKNLEWFSNNKAAENTVELEDLEKRKGIHEVLCKGGKYGSMGFNCGILFVFSWKSNPKWIIREDQIYKCCLCEKISVVCSDIEFTSSQSFL